MTRCKKVVGDLSCMSEIIEKLLTVIFCNNILQYHSTVWRQLHIEEITREHVRFLPFPSFHDKHQCCDEPKALVEVIVSQSKDFRGNGDGLKRASGETLRYIDLPFE